MKVVILCGGLGSRLSEETKLIPKPMVKIGGIPILKHIMKIYSYYGFNDFIVATGYKSKILERYFRKSKNVKCVLSNIEIITSNINIFLTLILFKATIIDGETPPAPNISIFFPTIS